MSAKLSVNWMFCGQVKINKFLIQDTAQIHLCLLVKHGMCPQPAQIAGSMCLHQPAGEIYRLLEGCSYLSIMAVGLQGEDFEF